MHQTTKKKKPNAYYIENFSSQRCNYKYKENLGMKNTWLKHAICKHFHTVKCSIVQIVRNKSETSQM